MENNQEQNIKDILDIVTFVKDNAATKEELDKFATKEDLDRFATKEDLKIVKDEIKEDLKSFATKEDLSTVKDEIMDKVEYRLKETKDEIMTQIDGLIVLVKNFQAELAALRSKQERMEIVLKKVTDFLKLEQYNL